MSWGETKSFRCFLFKFISRNLNKFLEEKLVCFFKRVKLENPEKQTSKLKMENFEAFTKLFSLSA